MIKGKKAARCGREERRGEERRGEERRGERDGLREELPCLACCCTLGNISFTSSHFLSLHIHIYVCRRTQTHTNGNPFQGVSPPAVPVNRIKSESATSQTKIYRAEAFAVFQVSNVLRMDSAG